MVQPEAQDGYGHHENFHQLRADHHAALAIAIRQIAAHHGKENERQRKQRAHDENQIFPGALREIHGDDDVNHQELDGVVVEGVLELGDD